MWFSIVYNADGMNDSGAWCFVLQSGFQDSPLIYSVFFCALAF